MRSPSQYYVWRVVLCHLVALLAVGESAPVPELRLEHPVAGDAPEAVRMEELLQRVHLLRGDGQAAPAALDGAAGRRGGSPAVRQVLLVLLQETPDAGAGPLALAFPLPRPPLPLLVLVAPADGQGVRGEGGGGGGEKGGGREGAACSESGHTVMYTYIKSLVLTGQDASGAKV